MDQDLQNELSSQLPKVMFVVAYVDHYGDTHIEYHETVDEATKAVGSNDHVVGRYALITEGTLKTTHRFVPKKNLS